MKDFVTYDVSCTLGKQRVLDIVTRNLPDFRWRQGDSDSQGSYISGINGDDVQIKLWLGEAPVSMSVAFDDVWIGELNREEKKDALIQLLDKVVIPLLGAVTKKDA